MLAHSAAYFLEDLDPVSLLAAGVLEFGLLIFVSVASLVASMLLRFSKRLGRPQSRSVHLAERTLSLVLPALPLALATRVVFSLVELLDVFMFSAGALLPFYLGSQMFGASVALLPILACMFLAPSSTITNKALTFMSVIMLLALAELFVLGSLFIATAHLWRP